MVPEYGVPLYLATSPCRSWKSARLIGNRRDVLGGMLLSAAKTWEFAPATKDGLAVRYRSLGRSGPFRTEVDLLPGAMGVVARATLRDHGAAGAIVAVATCTNRPLPSVERSAPMNGTMMSDR